MPRGAGENSPILRAETRMRSRPRPRALPPPEVGAPTCPFGRLSNASPASRPVPTGGHLRSAGMTQGRVSESGFPSSRHIRQMTYRLILISGSGQVSVHPWCLPTINTSRPWTMRQYAGFGTAAESNERYRQLLAAGTMGCRWRSKPAHPMGYDSDDPIAHARSARSAWPSTRSTTCAAVRRHPARPVFPR